MPHGDRATSGFNKPRYRTYPVTGYHSLAEQWWWAATGSQNSKLKFESQGVSKHSVPPGLLTSGPHWVSQANTRTPQQL